MRPQFPKTGFDKKKNLDANSSLPGPERSSRWSEKLAPR